jgi:hypothetical protein
LAELEDRVTPVRVPGWDGEHVVAIAMLPLLTRRDDVAELTSGYGQIIVDECHHVAAAAYEHSVTKIGAQFWLGLTATPSRRDGLGDLVVWQLGPVRRALDQSEESTLIDVTNEPSVLNRELYVHETTLVLDDIDPLDARCHRRCSSLTGGR